MAEKLTVAAGRNIRFVLAVQAVAQIAHVYGEKAAEIVLGNCDTWLYLRTADNDTARAISTKAGTYTVRTLTVQRYSGRGDNRAQFCPPTDFFFSGSPDLDHCPGYPGHGTDRRVSCLDAGHCRSRLPLLF